MERPQLMQPAGDGDEWVDGVLVPQQLITDDETMTDHRGSVRVQSGRALVITGVHQGSLHLDPNAWLYLEGSHQGSLHVASGAVANVSGTQQGSTHVAAGGEVRISPTGALQGSLQVEGTLYNAGRRGGSETGQGQITDLPSGRVIPAQYRNGVTYYDWY